MDFFENIEEYVEGLLSEEDRLLFEGEMEKDDKLAKAVRNYPIAKKISAGLLEIDIRQTLEKLKVEKEEGLQPYLKPKQPGIVISFRKWAASIAATIIALGAGGTFWYMQTLRAFQTGVFAEYYEAPKDPDATRSIDTLAMNSFELGKYRFNTNEFEKSETALLQTIDKTSNADTLSKSNYWLGHVYLNEKKWNKAINAFEKSIEVGTDDNLKLLRVIKKKEPVSVLE